MAESVAEAVRRYIDSHPDIGRCLQGGIINYSALARAIVAKTGIEGEGAIIAACKRYTLKGGTSEERITPLLERSRIEIRTKIATMTLRNEYAVFERLEREMKTMLGRRMLQAIQGSSGITLVLDEDLLGRIRGAFDAHSVLGTRKGLVEILVHSPVKIEETPGVVSHLTSALSGRGINIVEMMSCHTDTMFIVAEKDMVEAFRALSDVRSFAVERRVNSPKR